MANRSLKEVIAYHGWGFEASCWQHWQSHFRQHFRQQGWQFKTFDRGYWQQPLAPTFHPTAQTKVLLVHSYGLHLCPMHQLRQADILVIFSSFARFHPSLEHLKRRSQKILQQMIDQFAVKPLEVLSQFRMNCYHPCDWTEPLSDCLNRDLLLHDLINLQTAEIDPALLQTIPQILIFQGSHDRIVPSASSHEFINQLLKRNSAYASVNHQSNRTDSIRCQLIETAGHALPFTHLDGCWSKLQAYLHEITYE
jgi:pimeloyl-[acyl-carrier protein] methyl ester esterase